MKNNKNTLTKENVLEKIRATVPRPLKIRELIQTLKIPSEQRSFFRRQIEELTREGLLVKIKGERYGLTEKMNLIHGVLDGHSDGYGFVMPDIKGESDIYVHARNLNGAMHGDKVVCRVESFRKDGKREGRVIRILERKYKNIVGIFEQGEGNYGFVIPEEKKISQHIFIPLKDKGKAKDGLMVMAEITRYPQVNKNPEGKILEVIGDPAHPEVEAKTIIYKYELPLDFPPAVLAETEQIKSIVPEEEIRRRLDFGDLNIFTIDGEKARDFDDAVSIERKKNGYQLGVHIADVSYYVKPGSLLDQEARERGTSVYFPDRVIPMLPPALSDDLCSLRPRETRLTLSAIIDFDHEGNVTKHQIKESVINSKERLTYTIVADILENPSSVHRKNYAHILDDLFLMQELCTLLRKKRFAEGSLDFDLPESEIILDIQGKPQDIVKIERNIAHKLIEEFMLSANRVVALHLCDLKITTLYRVHETPDPEKILQFDEFIRNFGLRLKSTHNLHPLTLQKIILAVKDKPEEMLINTLLLRSMKQARYTTENIGHFGLAFEHYTHFTSPIRRYPDLIIHRLLKGARPEGLARIAEHTSVRERTAEEAEREIVDLKKVQFMEDKIGEIYEGIISGVTSFGMFVELKEYFVEGLIHISNIGDDYYIYEEKNHCLIGEHTRKTFRIGDPVKVQVAKVNPAKRQIDLSLLS